MGIDLAGKFVGSYPADLQGGAGIGVTKTGLRARLALDFRNAPVLDVAPLAGVVLVQDPVTGEMRGLDFQKLPTSNPGDGTVSNPKLAAAPPLSFKGNQTGATAQPQDVSADTANAIIGAAYTPDTRESSTRPTTMVTYLRREKWKGPHVFDYIPSSRHDAIQAGTSTADVTQELRNASIELSNAALADAAKGFKLRLVAGKYNISGKVQWNGVGTQIECDGIGGTVLNVTANLGADEAAFEFRQQLANYSGVGAGLRGLRINMNGFVGHGLRFWKPYDGVEIADIYIDNIADANCGLMIVPDPIVYPADPYSQTVFVRNVLAIHKNATATGSLFYIEALNEAVFTLCKGFGTYFAQTNNGANLPNCHPFELVDCNGVNLIQCSGAFANEHAFRVRATGTRIARSVVIDTPTIEFMRGALRADGQAGADEAVKVLDLELRSPRKVFPNVPHPSGDIVLNRVRAAVIEAKDFVVVSGTPGDTGRCRIKADTSRALIAGFGPTDRIDLLPQHFNRTNIAATLTANQTGLSGADFTTVNFVATSDPTLEFDSTTRTATLVNAGRYRVECAFGVIPASAGIVAARLLVNGAVNRLFFSVPDAPAGLFTDFSGSMELDLAAGNTLTLQVFNAGGTISNEAVRTYLRITAVANTHII